jgi:hypothetical protein
MFYLCVNNVSGRTVKDTAVTQKFPADNVLMDNFLCNRFIYVAVNDRRHTGDNYFGCRLRMTQAHAPGLPYNHRIHQILARVNFRQERIQCPLCPGRNAAGSHSYNNLNFLAFGIPLAQVILFFVPQFP